MNVHLVLLSEGDGDVYIYIHDPAFIAWCDKDPNFKLGEYSKEESFPKKFVDIIQSRWTEEHNVGHRVTSGSWWNDRLINICSSTASGDYKELYFTIKEAMEAIRANNDVLTEEHHGLLY